MAGIRAVQSDQQCALSTVNMMKTKVKLSRALALAGLMGLFSQPCSSRAQDTNTIELIQKLQKRVEELEQKVKDLDSGRLQAEQAAEAQSKRRAQELDQKFKVLERKQDIEKEAAESRARQTPSISLGANGLMVRSADSNFLMNVHGYIQADGRFYLNDLHPANDTFLLRRVRPIIEGSIYDKFDYRFMADFGSGNVTGSSAGNNALLDDAFVNARFWPQFQIQAGKFKSPVGLERLQSSAELLFVETGFATQLTPNYDLGVELHNSLFNSPINYAIGIFNGAIDGGSDDADTTDQGKDIAGRLFFQPFLKTGIEPLRKFGFGVGGSFGQHQGTLPTYRTPGQQTFFTYTNGVAADGHQYRIDPQFYYYCGPFGIIGEYAVSSQKVKSSASGSPHRRFEQTAWQIEGSYFLTGDENSFRSTSRNLFHPRRSLGSGGFGALELVARVGQMTLDPDAYPLWVTAASASEATSWGVGLNWYLNSNLRLYVDYERTWFDGGTAAGSVTAQDENVILGRVQVAF